MKCEVKARVSIADHLRWYSKTREDVFEEQERHSFCIVLSHGHGMNIASFRAIVIL